MELTLLTTTLGSSSLFAVLDFAFKSFLILAFLTALIGLIRPRIASSTAHLLWLTGFLSIALLPIAQLLMQSVPVSWQGLQSVGVFTVTPETAATAASTGWTVTAVLFFLYVLVAMALLLKLVSSARDLVKLDRTCHELDDDENGRRISQQFKASCEKLKLTRTVQLKTGSPVQSPLSYGLRKPTVLVPANIDQWSDAVREEVFTHELSHIKRYDWLTLIATHIMTSLLWINPLLWLASKRLHDEAEQACDSANIQLEADRVRYAEHLLSLAKNQRGDSAASLLAQPMYDGSELTLRIKNILEGRVSRGITRATLSAFILCSVLLGVAGNGVELFAAEDNPLDQEYLPTRTMAPQYPRRAADEGIEGWILFSFTVRADGLIDTNSVAVVDAEPAGYFETSAQRALLQFEFEPRIRNGLAEDVPGVQYLFRYELEDDGVPDFDRPPPQANP